MPNVKGAFVPDGDCPAECDSYSYSAEGDVYCPPPKCHYPSRDFTNCPRSDVNDGGASSGDDAEDAEPPSVPISGMLIGGKMYEEHELACGHCGKSPKIVPRGSGEKKPKKQKKSKKDDVVVIEAKAVSEQAKTVIASASTSEVPAAVGSPVTRMRKSYGAST